jgi:hypothetical protein
LGPYRGEHHIESLAQNTGRNHRMKPMLGLLGDIIVVLRFFQGWCGHVA